MTNLIEKIKKFIVRHPEFVLVKNKHRLNTIIMKNEFPRLKEFSDEELREIFKRVVNLDREVRKAKEELREENKISISANEKELLQILEQQKQLELGYEPGFNNKLNFN